MRDLLIGVFVINKEVFMWRKVILGLLVVGVAWAITPAQKYAMDSHGVSPLGNVSPPRILEGWNLVESQDFNDGAIPADWELNDANGDQCTWVVVSEPTDPYNPGCWDESPFLQYSDDDCDTDSDDWIMTAVFSISDGDSTYLVYDFDFEELGTGAPLEYGDVMIGTSEDGTNWDWTVVVSYTDDMGENCDVTVGPVVVTGNYARWAFRYWEDTPSNWAWGWYIDNVEVYHYSTEVGVAERTAGAFRSFSVHPNPALGRADVSFALDRDASVKLEVLDVAGRVLETLENSRLGTGNYSYSLNENAGIYFVKLTVNGISTIKRLVVVK